MNNRVIRRRQRGQGMTEYIIIVALVAIAAIAVYSFFGDTVRGQMANITDQLGGGTGATGRTAVTAGQAGANKEATHYGLQDYETSGKNANGGGGKGG